MPGWKGSYDLTMVNCVEPGVRIMKALGCTTVSQKATGRLLSLSFLICEVGSNLQRQAVEKLG